MDEKQVSPDELRKSLADMRESLMSLIEYQASWAILLKARHDALLKAGFSKKMAEEIIKARGMGA